LLIKAPKTLKIKEQIINDPVTGLILIFRLTPKGKEPRLHIIGDILPFGNRDFQRFKKTDLRGFTFIRR
jgi:hypothetical protein